MTSFWYMHFQCLTMNLLFLIDLAAFSEKGQQILSQCLVTTARLLQCAAISDANARWGYRLIDSRCKPEAFQTLYKTVAGHSDGNYPSASVLEKGKQALLCLANHEGAPRGTESVVV